MQRELSHPLVFAANRADLDTMYMHQAMPQPDRMQFDKAMQDEINAHTKNRHWEVIDHLQVPEGAKILPSVRVMKRKEESPLERYTSGKQDSTFMEASMNMVSIIGKLMQQPLHGPQFGSC